MSEATLTIVSRNYGSWSLRGWLLCRLAGLDVEVEVTSADDAAARAELLLLSPSFLVPSLTYGGVTVWDTMAIAEYLHELRADAGLYPADIAQRAHCRAVCGEMHSGFANLRSALSMNLKAHHAEYPIWTGARADVDRIVAVWRDCLETYGGPYLFGDRPTVADVMYAPVCTRFATYDVALDPRSQSYCDTILALDAIVEWIEEARAEPDQVHELEMEF